MSKKLINVYRGPYPDLGIIYHPNQYRCVDCYKILPYLYKIRVLEIDNGSIMRDWVSSSQCYECLVQYYDSRNMKWELRDSIKTIKDL